MALGSYVQDVQALWKGFASFGQKLPGIARATRALGALPCRHGRALSSALSSALILQEGTKAPNGSDLRTPNSSSTLHLQTHSGRSCFNMVVSCCLQGWDAAGAHTSRIHQGIRLSEWQWQILADSNLFLCEKSEINVETGCQLCGNFWRNVDLKGSSYADGFAKPHHLPCPSNLLATYTHRCDRVDRQSTFRLFFYVLYYPSESVGVPMTHLTSLDNFQANRTTEQSNFSQIAKGVHELNLQTIGSQKMAHARNTFKGCQI